MYTFLTLLILIIVATITKGVISLYKREMSTKANVKKALRVNLFSIVPVLTAFIITMIPQVAHAATAEATSATGFGFVGVALSTGLASLGAGIAVGSIGSSALGAVSEDPKMLGKTLIFIGLGEGIAIYGLIISIIILGRL